jgi:ATP-dependent Clp protease ATP-binding subunit ClpA
LRFLAGGRTVDRMFERFTEDARQVIVRAQGEARELRHHYIGTEHILLGLFDEDTSAAGTVLESLGLELDAARSDVIEIVGIGDEKVSSGQIPFTPRAKKVLELSLREALSLGHNYIATGHVLLALSREGEGVAAAILRDHGIADDVLRTAILETLHEEAPPPGRIRRAMHGTRQRVAFRTSFRWEYHVEDGLDSSRLAALGAEGWELVAAVPGAEAVQLVFKRTARQPPVVEQQSA